MTGVSLEAALEEWASSLREGKERIRPLFVPERMAHFAGLFLDFLLGPERRKTGWMRAQAAGDPGPWRQQALLGRAGWDAEGLRDVVRGYAVETLGEPGRVLVVDETGSPCCQRSASAPTKRRPQRRSAGCARSRPHPLVGPGNPACGHATGPAPHPTRPRDRAVNVATRPPGRRTRHAYHQKIATVMLDAKGSNESVVPSGSSSRRPAFCCWPELA